MRKPVLILCLMLLLAACGRGETPDLSAFEFHYRGKVVSMVNQRGKEFRPGVRVRYTLGVEGFQPDPDRFETYLSQFHEGMTYYPIEITKRTTVYKQEGNQRYRAKAEDIEPGQMIDFWVAVFPENEYYLEAKEITIREAPPTDE